MNDAVSLGPIVLPTGVLVLVATLIVATLVATRTARRTGVAVDGAVYAVALIGLVVARLVFVLSYIESYRAAPLSVFNIRDGGWMPWPGVLAAALAVLGLAWRRPPLRRALRDGAMSAAAVGLAGSLYMVAPSGPATTLPDLAATTADGKAISLRAFAGRPLVLNIWASWCPPCVREMPALQAAQAEHPDVHIVFLNQRESPEKIQRFLKDQGLALANVLRDPAGEAARVFMYRGLPTTLFFDASGTLVDSRPGELSRASLQQHLDKIKSPPAQPPGNHAH